MVQARGGKADEARVVGVEVACKGSGDCSTGKDEIEGVFDTGVGGKGCGCVVRSRSLGERVDSHRFTARCADVGKECASNLLEVGVWQEGQACGGKMWRFTHPEARQLRQR